MMHTSTWVPVPLLLCLVCAPGGAGERDGLLLEYRFDGNLQDTSGGGHDGTVVGEAKFGPGREGQALVFDGATYLDSGFMLPELETFTAECWVNPGPEQCDWADILGNHAGGGVSGLVIQQRSDETNAFTFVYGSASGGYVESAPVPLTAGRWQHIALVKDANEMRGYVNGVLLIVMAAKGPMAASNASFRVGLGFPFPNRCFRGLIDEVKLWDRPIEAFGLAISEAEQLELFTAMASRSDALRVAWPAAPGVAATAAPVAVVLSVDSRVLPPVIERVEATMEIRDVAGGEVTALTPVILHREGGFRAPLGLPIRPGYYQATARMVAHAGQRAIPLASSSFSFLVPRPPVPLEEIPTVPTTRILLDGDDWLLAIDPANQGRDDDWRLRPVQAAKQAAVPWIIQEAFPGYHGLAWYWRSFQAPANPYASGRYVLRFAQVDYLAEVWLNGQPVGGHEGGETPFELDVTDAIRAGEENQLAVRVLNPTHERIDGIVLGETPHRCKVMPYGAGAAYNHGGITGSVELALTPPVSLSSLWLRPDADSGRVRVRLRARNSLAETVTARVTFTIVLDTAAHSPLGLPVAVERTLSPGDTEVEVWLQVNAPKLWDLATPVLYRVTARLQARGLDDEISARCGFRDFRFRDGAFRLNGRRLFLRSAHTVNHFPVGLQFPHDPDFARRDLFNAKAMGFNMVRFICGGATPEQLDLCDELGLMVYEESYASWVPMADTPQLGERFDRSVGEVIARDRNHPSVVIWGLLNEAPDGPVFQHAVASLPLVRYLDDSRLVMLNSGRWDGHREIGSLANPDSLTWELSLGMEGMSASEIGNVPPQTALGYTDGAGDSHVYVKVPQTALATTFLRTMGQGTRPVFLSEYGIGSAVDLWRTVRHYERLGKSHLEDAQFYADKLSRFLGDWERWQLGDCFASPENFFEDSLARMAGQRTLGLNAIRSNPNLIGHNLTGMIDHVMSGEGLTTAFREHKPGAIDAVYAAWAPLRLCLFAEPFCVVRNERVTLEGVLANEDVLPPGTYPVRLLLVAPDGSRALDRIVDMVIPTPEPGHELPFALPFFEAEIPVDGPAGRWRFQASIQSGAAATGGLVEFDVVDPAGMPAVGGEVVLFGDDPGLATWLADHAVVSRPWAPGALAQGTVVLAGANGVSGTSSEREAACRELARQVEQGARAVFLCPAVFAADGNPDAYLSMFAPGHQVSLNSWLYLMDVWGKDHPLFDGLQTGGLLDYRFYRDLIRDTAFAFDAVPDQPVAGAINAAVNYGSGLMLSVHNLGEGRVTLTSFLVRETLGKHPAAERLLRNMLRQAATP